MELKAQLLVSDNLRHWFVSGRHSGTSSWQID